MPAYLSDPSNSFLASEGHAGRSQDSDSGQESAAASDVAVAGAPSGEGAKFPHPKNFAERLMNVLQRGIASDSIWWVGGDVNGVALRPKKLKKGTLLQTHFSGNQYSAFLRSFNRWGFRRVACHEAPDGAVIYRNCLFQMDKPHLVKHMRMDSDVQDVFARHQLSGESNSSASSDPSASQPASVTTQSSVVPTQQSTAAPKGNNDAANLLQQLLTALANPQGQSQQQQKQPSPPIAFANRSGAPTVPQHAQSFVDGSASAKKAPKVPPAQVKPAAKAGQCRAPKRKNGQKKASARRSQQKAPRASDLRPPQGVSSASISSSQLPPVAVPGMSGGTVGSQAVASTPTLNQQPILASTLEALIRTMHQGERKPPPEPRRNTLLRQILAATKDYMDRVPSSTGSTSSENGIQTTLELLQLIGQEELKGNGRW